MLALSTSGIDLIKSFENFHSTPYWDVRQYSWGYGTKAPGPTGTITRSQAEKALKDHVATVESDIHRFVTSKGVSLSQNQFDALVSLVYNVGVGNIFTKVYNNGFARGSSLYNKLLNRDYQGAGAHFADFNKADSEVSNGLVRRRAEEAALWFSNNASTIKKTGTAIVLLSVVLAAYIAFRNKKPLKKSN